MGRKAKNRIKKHVSHDPQFIADIEVQAIEAESFGETVERLLAEKSDTILELRQQLAEYQRHGMQQSQDTDEAIRQVSLALQAWMVNPADTVARAAFETAFASALKQTPRL